MTQYVDYIIEQAKALLSIDSPSGFTEEAAQYLMQAYQQLGYQPQRTKKGGVLVDLGGEDAADAVLLEGHTDTLGGIVAEIKANGRLRISPIGGMNSNNAESENCRIYTRFDGVYSGTCQLNNASMHVNPKYDTEKRTFDTVEIVLDESTTSKEDTIKLGIRPGDFVCFAPRTVVTETGYIKSRFLDDKLSVAILLGFAKYLKDNHIVTKRNIYHHLTVFEEVGHGGSASVPEGVTEVISVDMGCVGEGLSCTEREVSICAKDSGGPYHYDVVTNLVKTAKELNLGYAVDVYPLYISDVEASLAAGCDVRHGLIGPGVYASHGYERSHKDGVRNTLQLLIGYLAASV